MPADCTLRARGRQVQSGVHVVHFKGRFKPWELIHAEPSKHPCHAATHGAHMVHGRATRAVHRPQRAVRDAVRAPVARRYGAPCVPQVLVAATAPAAEPPQLVEPHDDLVWSGGKCMSRRHQREVRWGASPEGHVNTWINRESGRGGGPLGRPCCDGHTLLLSYWFYVAELNHQLMCTHGPRNATGGAGEAERLKRSCGGYPPPQGLEQQEQGQRQPPHERRPRGTGSAFDELVARLRGRGGRHQS